MHAPKPHAPLDGFYPVCVRVCVCVCIIRCKRPHRHTQTQTQTRTQTQTHLIRMARNWAAMARVHALVRILSRLLPSQFGVEVVPSATGRRGDKRPEMASNVKAERAGQHPRAGEHGRREQCALAVTALLTVGARARQPAAFAVGLSFDAAASCLRGGGQRRT